MREAEGDQDDSARRAAALLARSVVWDDHACMPLRPGDESFLPQLQRHRAAGVSMVLLNVGFDSSPPGTVVAMLAQLRSWIGRHPAEYVLAERVEDIRAAKREGRLAIAFDIEGGAAVQPHPGLVEVYYRLGVRWMLIAYNRANGLGGGCIDDVDAGLTDEGRRVIDEMNRVGMVLCCSHTGYRTAREAIDHSRNPVTFSHSNARAVADHPRNIPDDLIVACAVRGGVVNLCGIGDFLGDPSASTEALLRHIEHVVEVAGPGHVGIGLDYVFDPGELDGYLRDRPDLFPAGIADSSTIEPERIPEIAEALLRRGYDEVIVAGILGGNNLRLAEAVWQ